MAYSIFFLANWRFNLSLTIFYNFQLISIWTIEVVHFEIKILKYLSTNPTIFSALFICHIQFFTRSSIVKELSVVRWPIGTLSIRKWGTKSSPQQKKGIIASPFVWLVRRNPVESFRKSHSIRLNLLHPEGRHQRDSSFSTSLENGNAVVFRSLFRLKSCYGFSSAPSQMADTAEQRRELCKTETSGNCEKGKLGSNSPIIRICRILDVLASVTPEMILGNVGGQVPENNVLLKIRELRYFYMGAYSCSNYQFTSFYDYFWETGSYEGNIVQYY